MKPIADFACLSGKCDRKGQATTYELPINAVRCPVCGTKKIKRLFNRVNVRIGAAKPDLDMRHTSSSVARRVDQIAEPAMVQADQSAARLREARLKYPGARMVPTGRMREAIGEIVTGMGSSRVPNISVDPPDRKAVPGGTLGGVVEELGTLRGGGVPTKVEARDREFKVVRGGDGTVGMEKA